MAIIGWHQATTPSDAFVGALRSAQTALWPLIERAAARTLAPPVLLITDSAIFDDTRSQASDPARTRPIAGCVTLTQGLEVRLGPRAPHTLRLRHRARVIAVSESRGARAAAMPPGPAITLELVMTTALALETIRWLCGDGRAADRATEPFIVHAAARRVLAELPAAPRCLAFLDGLLGLPAAPTLDDDGRIEF